MAKKFDELEVKLSQPVLKTLEELNFVHATPIQAECIPYLLKNKDVAAEAVTGSGKTIAFVVPLIEMLLRRDEPLKKNQVGGLIISPTRELASQTHEVISKFLSNIEQLSQVLLVGGNPVNDDVQRILTDGANIITATPGRLEELLTKNFSQINLHKSFKELEILVLDEADKLLDLGFERSLRAIMQYLPSQRRTGLFSATQTRQIATLVKAGMRNPVLIEVKEKKMKNPDSEELENESTPSTLSNYYMICKADQKLAVLIDFVRKKGYNLKYMLFFSSCAVVDYFQSILKHFLPEIQQYGLHGKMKAKRQVVFKQFKECASGMLLCTDIVARGVDIPEVNWVIQYDAPNKASSFVHRCGRTARIGHVGNALTLLMPNEDAYPNFILRNQKVQLKKMHSVKCDNIDKLIEEIHSLQLRDRLIFDKANRAFVSYFQGYSMHDCNVILRVKDLNICRLARGFGLLKLPKMPELKGRSVCGFQPVDVDLNSIKYLNKDREKNRLEKLRKYKETGIWPSTEKKKHQKPTVPWSETKDRKVARKERREKRKIKKQQVREHTRPIPK